jgi:hypothetical protein
MHARRMADGKRSATGGAGSPQAKKRSREADDSAAPRSCAICLLDAPPSPQARALTQVPCAATDGVHVSPSRGEGAARADESAPDGAPSPDTDSSGQFWALRERHGCSTCKPDAWFICEECHLGRLSRQCPICRGDYAPEVLHPFPTDALALPASDLRSRATRQVLALALVNSNTVVWTPGERTGAFCLLPSSADGNFVCTPAFA